jgi:deoxyribonuclease V
MTPFDVPHPWDLEPAAARAVQERLRARVVHADELGDVARVAGVDVGFEDGGETTRAAVAVLSFPDLEPLEDAVARLPTAFPYVPGLLSFRELPAVLEALASLERLPDVLLCDGQGIAHPRRLGIASHLGVITDLPTVGVAKSRLTGTHAPVPDTKAAWVPLLDERDVIGAVVRTRRGVKPVYVSIGHRVSLERAVELTLACVTRYKLPETTRRADRIASRR